MSENPLYSGSPRCSWRRVPAGSVVHHAATANTGQRSSSRWVNTGPREKAQGRGAKSYCVNKNKCMRGSHSKWWIGMRSSRSDQQPELAASAVTFPSLSGAGRIKNPSRDIFISPGKNPQSHVWRKPSTAIRTPDRLPQICWALCRARGLFFCEKSRTPQAERKKEGNRGEPRRPRGISVKRLRSHGCTYQVHISGIRAGLHAASCDSARTKESVRCTEYLCRTPYVRTGTHKRARFHLGRHTRYRPGILSQEHSLSSSKPNRMSKTSRQ